MRRRLGSVFVVLLMLAGVMVLPAGASASGLVVLERDESAMVGVEAFVRVGVPEGASGVRTEVPDGEDWVESEAGVLEADGNYSILLSFGDGAVGVFTYRVVADVAGEVVSSEVFEFVRTAADSPEETEPEPETPVEPEPSDTPEEVEVESEVSVEPETSDEIVAAADPDPVSVTASSAGTKVVGALSYVWGRVSGHSGGQVFTEVMTSNGWSRSQVRASSATGYYQIPLTYGANTVGAYTWRVGAVAPGGTVYSEPFEFIRTAPVVSVTASSAGTKVVGALSYVWGRVSGHSGGQVFTEVMTSNGWSRSQVRASSATGYYQIPLTYGANTVGAYTWRVGAVAPGGTVYSEPFDFVRTATVSASAPQSSPIGSLATVSGRVGGHSGGQVFTEVMTSNGWSRSQVRVSSATGYYQIPLTYGANTLGTYTWRVGAVTPVGTTYSRTFTLTRTPKAPPRTLHLSFDDGPNSVYTSQLLNLLARYNARATFFPVGSSVSSGAAVLRRVAADGHAIGNHTFNHPSLAGISEARFRSEILSSQNVIAATTGIRPTCLRPPYGAMDSRTRSRAAALGLSIELWTVDPQDWRRPGASTIASRVIQRAGPGSVVVMHDGGGNRSQTVAAVEQILANFSARGYTFTAMPGC